MSFFGITAIRLFKTFLSTKPSGQSFETEIVLSKFSLTGSASSEKTPPDKTIVLPDSKTSPSTKPSGQSFEIVLSKFSLTGSASSEKVPPDKTIVLPDSKTSPSTKPLGQSLKNRKPRFNRKLPRARGKDFKDFISARMRLHNPQKFRSEISPFPSVSLNPLLSHQQLFSKQSSAENFLKNENFSL